MSIGPISDVAPEFPLAAGALAPLRAKAEAQGSGDFSPLWAGQAASLGCTLPAGELTRKLAADALARLREMRQPVARIAVTQSKATHAKRKRLRARERTEIADRSTE